MGYSADYQPLSSYASSWKAQQLLSQQKVVNHAMHGHVFASENTTQGSRCRRNQVQASHGWADGDNKQGSTSKKFLKKKHAVILGRDFLLINCTFQSFLKPNKAFRFFHLRASVGNGIQDGDQVASPLPAHSPQLDDQAF
ncbi:hypothetical protein RHMOL_Rhmol02G0197200 [Rhododendron molle]|uniref:Uncharacterized protein n=1 Tax=Rhododendron molle TaxID=49168 RepID=A0ACC0PTE0_RHOML|nr:hypothetical protein RHMOL_Rhmol02G0197200 [Rhododendron molle]